MAKHFIGFGLFGSIVGFFVLTSWFFSSSPIARVEVVESPSAVAPWTYCDKKRRPKSVDSPRAMADRKSGMITLYINELPGGSHVDPNEVNASFTFYAVRGDEARVVDVIHDSLVRSVRSDSGPKWILQYDAAWVKGLSWEDNLYVVPGARDGSNHKALAAAFSVDSAMPVLIRN